MDDAHYIISLFLTGFTLNASISIYGHHDWCHQRVCCEQGNHFISLIHAFFLLMLLKNIKLSLSVWGLRQDQMKDHLVKCGWDYLFIKATYRIHEYWYIQNPDVYIQHVLKDNRKENNLHIRRPDFISCNFYIIDRIFFP